jgi:hypothetical protein
VAPTVPCPSCGTALVPPTSRCAACGLALTGPAARELWEVDRRLAALAQRRQVLLADLRAPGPAVGLPSPPTPTALPAGRRRGP